MECYYHPNCRTPTQFIIIYGCLNQHLWDRPLCTEHTTTWLKNYDIGIPCGWPTCNLDLDQYEIISSHKVDYRQLYWYKARYDRTPIIMNLLTEALTIVLACV